MLLTIVAIWAIVIPLGVLALGGQAAYLRQARVSPTADRTTPQPHQGMAPTGGMPACAVRDARPRRTITRRVCPERPRGAGRRPASA